jgi:hypothetical protein
MYQTPHRYRLSVLTAHRPLHGHRSRQSVCGDGRQRPELSDRLAMNKSNYFCWKWLDTGGRLVQHRFLIGRLHRELCLYRCRCSPKPPGAFIRPVEPWFGPRRLPPPSSPRRRAIQSIHGRSHGQRSSAGASGGGHSRPPSVIDAVPRPEEVTKHITEHRAARLGWRFALLSDEMGRSGCLRIPPFCAERQAEPIIRGLSRATVVDGQQAERRKGVTMGSDRGCRDPSVGGQFAG